MNRCARGHAFVAYCPDGRSCHAEIEREAWRPFDLAHGPLLRVTLFTGLAAGSVLVLSIHHIIADFWSLGLLARQLGALYSGAELGPAPAYSAFTERQVAMLAGEEGEGILDAHEVRF